MSNLEAGKGSFFWKIYPSHPSDNTLPTELKKDFHYIDIQVVKWFVNQQSNVTTRLAAAGDVVIKIGASEEYQVGLGSFALANDNKEAPSINKSILPWRSYKGGRITIVVRLTLFKDNTIISKMLQNTAKISLEIVEGMVNTATNFGLNVNLAKASKELIDGVQKILASQDRTLNIFDTQGFSIELDSTDILHDKLYILMYRGEESSFKFIKVNIDEDVPEFLVTRNGKESKLGDGAWVLFKINRNKSYKDSRPWMDDIKEIKKRIAKIFHNYEIIKQTDTPAQFDKLLSDFTTTTSGNMTVMDYYHACIAKIYSDGVIGLDEAHLWAKEILDLVLLAQEAIVTRNPQIYSNPQANTGITVQNLTSLALPAANLALPITNPSATDLSGDSDKS